MTSVKTLLVLENLILYKNEQAKVDKEDNWKEEFELD